VTTLADIPDHLPIAPADQQFRALDIFLEHVGMQVHKIEITHLENPFLHTLVPTFLKYGYMYTQTTLVDYKMTLRTCQSAHWDNPAGWTHWFDVLNS